MSAPTAVATSVPTAAPTADARASLGSPAMGPAMEAILAGGDGADRAVEWGRVRAATLLFHQQLRYEYPEAVRGLKHRLMVLPPAVHGDQARREHRIAVAGAPAQMIERLDAFSNHVADIAAPRVERYVEFDVWSVVERSASVRHLVAERAVSDPRLVRPSALTGPDAALEAAARDLAVGPGGLALAERINAWVYAALGYRDGATDVWTTAAGALAIGEGVCQDYAHVMLALARLCGLPARYVSGHLVGEGGSHAWVEVLIAGAPGQPGTAVAFDPTHNRRAGLEYLTVAVGRDYNDVAPTSGTYCSDAPGVLSVCKRLRVAALDLGPDPAPTSLPLLASSTR